MNMNMELRKQGVRVPLLRSRLVKGSTYVVLGRHVQTLAAHIHTETLPWIPLCSRPPGSH